MGFFATTQSRLQASLQRHPVAAAIGFFGAGVGYDVATITRIDSRLQLASQSAMLLLLWVILLFDLRQMEQDAPVRTGVAGLLVQRRSDIVHFLQGSLLSAFTILYTRSAGGWSALLFVGLLGLVMVLNETRTARRFRRWFPVFATTLATGAFGTYLFPILFRSLDAVYFYTGIGAAGILAGLVLYINRKTSGMPWLIIPAAAPLVLLAWLYASKSVPPIPLSVTRAGIFHKIEREHNTYRMYKADTLDWWRQWTGNDIAVRDGDRVYAFAQIFAPTGFKQTIMMVWSHRSKTNDTWTVTDRIPMVVSGGRDRGFRGYTYKRHHQPGYWRVEILTADTRVLSILNFQILADTDSGERAWTIQHSG